ncbi:MAG: SpoIIE family protein phosphatase, partial [Bacteroidota bacterium]
APGMESILLIPLRFRDKPMGVLTVQSSQKKAYTAFHLNLLKSIATHLTIALDNARIHQKLQLNHKKFKDSINYARQIQKALLPELKQIQKVIPNSFVLLKPRDVVSGDFYWFAQADLKPNYQKSVLNHVGFRPIFSKVKQSKYFLVVGDCTGHGVPGALMSMIGHDLLNEIILHYRESDAAHVLNRLHEGVKSCFRQENQSVGMDLGLCILDFEERVLEYAGAFMPLVHIQDGALQIIPGDKKPIGVWYEQKEVRQYQKHQIELSLEKESTFYISTDGYQDQLGGPKRKKLLSSNLHRLLLEIHQKPMEEQKKILDEYLLQWQGNEKQNDDILVMGFRVSPNDLIYHY